MIPYFGLIVGVIYVALSIAATVMFMIPRQRQTTPRIWIAAALLAAALLLNALGGEEWMLAGIWAFNVALATWNIRSTRHAVEVDRAFERVFGSRR